VGLVRQHHRQDLPQLLGRVLPIRGDLPAPALATFAASGNASVRSKVAESTTLLDILFGTGPDPNGPG
jgi:hypothetical protein